MAQDRLRELFRLNVLDRFRPPRPAGGSWPFRYVLGQLGVEIYAALHDEPTPPPAAVKARRRSSIGHARRERLLGANSFFTDLAGFARTHPHQALTRWWSADHCLRPSAFGPVSESDPPIIRPSGHGIWSRRSAQGGELRHLPFFLEYDVASEPLSQVADRVPPYTWLVADGEPAWPVLFWLANTSREDEFRQFLASTNLSLGNTPLPVATASRDFATNLGLSPAEAVWHLHGHEATQLTLDQIAAELDLPNPDVPYHFNG